MHSRDLWALFIVQLRKWGRCGVVSTLLPLDSTRLLSLCFRAERYAGSSRTWSLACAVLHCSSAIGSVSVVRRVVVEILPNDKFRAKPRKSPNLKVSQNCVGLLKARLLLLLWRTSIASSLMSPTEFASCVKAKFQWIGQLVRGWR